MLDPAIPIEVLVLVERIAFAIRRELGAAIDAYPGGRTPEMADPLNRVFRAIVLTLLAAGGVPESDLVVTTSRTLLSLAVRRLEGEGRDALAIKMLIEDEPGHPDDWLTFLILSSPEQIDPLLGPDVADAA